MYVVPKGEGSLTGPQSVKKRWLGGGTPGACRERGILFAVAKQDARLMGDFKLGTSPMLRKPPESRFFVILQGSFYSASWLSRMDDQRLKDMMQYL